MKRVTESSGNVFDDLGLTNSKELLARAELARQVYVIIKKRGLTQTAAAELLKLKQPDLSLLMRGRLARFSTDRLIQMLNVLDRDVEIVVRRKSSALRSTSTGWANSSTCSAPSDSATPPIAVKIFWAASTNSSPVRKARRVASSTPRRAWCALVEMLAPYKGRVYPQREFFGHACHGRRRQRWSQDANPLGFECVS